MARFGAGQMCVNFTGAGDENKAPASYLAETYAKLSAVKTHYDAPTGSASTRTSAPPTPDDRIGPYRSAWIIARLARAPLRDS